MKNQRIISFVLAMVIVFFTFPVTIFADNINKEATFEEDNSMVTDFGNDSSVSIEANDDFYSEFVSETSKIKSDPLIIDEKKIICVESSSKEILAAIKSNENFIIKGTIADEKEQIDINQYYDFSSTSKYHIAEWAHKANKITEEEKIECFCDLFISKNFNNIDCLEGVVAEIQNYQLKNEISKEMEQKIEKVITPPFDDDNSNISTRDISNEKTYKSENFAIHYNEEMITEAIAKSVADYFEEVRVEYINYGFKEPKLEAFKTRYQVYLDSESTSGSAVCVGTSAITNTCASHIIIYKFESLTATVKERIAHEYFHAIQNAYNYQSTWFKEACANWGKIIIAGTSHNTCDYAINSFVGASTPMIDSASSYGAVLYPLAIHKTYGGANAILSIYKVYNNYGASISESKLREVITKGINNTGSTAGFTEAYRRMAAFMYNTGVWYAEFSPTSESWDSKSKEILNVKQKTVTYSEFTVANEFNGTVEYLTSKYYKLSFPANYVGAVNIVVDYGSTNGRTQIYTVSDTGRNTIHFDTTNSDGSTVYTQPNVGNGILEVGLIISNVAENGSIGFNVKLSLLQSENTITFSSSKRYAERIAYVCAGEYVDYRVTFGSEGTKLIQTFGKIDTKIELYSNTGTLLLSNDDGGYESNALLRYYVSANTEYTIRVKGYSSSVFGDTKLSITPAFRAINEGASNIDSYEDIYAVTGLIGYEWGSFAQKNYTRVFTFAPSKSGDYTIKIESEADTHIYVIDPRSEMVLKNGKNYDDDSGENQNPLLTTSLEANIPYLIIYSMYDPNSITENVNMTVKISKN